MKDAEKKLAAAKEELRLSEERFNLIVNGTIEGIWDWPDSTKDEVYWSSQWKALLEYKDHELTANKTTFYNVLHPDDRERCAKAVKDCLEHDKKFDIEYRLQKKSGEYGWFHGRGVVSRNAGITRMIGSISDISKRKQDEQNTQKLLEKLIQSNAELEQFTYIATHDLRTPLRHIVTFNTLLQKEYAENLGEEGKEYIEISKKAALKMETIITDLLKYSQMPHVAKHLSEIDCKKVLQDALETLNESIQSTNTKIEFDEMPVVRAHPLYFNILLQNLIGNAIKYQNPGNQPIINIHTKDKGNCWQFCVTDNGIGIKSEYIESVFAPFKRLHGDHEFSGSGLGLAICKRIVNGFGGDIGVESEFKKGSTFYFTIPKI